MSNSHERFRDLRDVTGEGFESTLLRTRLDPVERRVARYRTGRNVLVCVVGAAVMGLFAFGTSQLGGFAVNEPAGAPSAAPDTAATHAGFYDPACNEATTIEGKPAGAIGGAEGWWNSTPVASCDQWDEVILDHPDTVTINTSDFTMMEANYRTSIDKLGVYADLSPDFIVPDPDPVWPEDSIIVIDARTGDVVSSALLSSFPSVDDAVDSSDTAQEVDPWLLQDARSLAFHAQDGIPADRVPDGFKYDSSFEEPDGLIPVRVYRDDTGLAVTIRLVSPLDEYGYALYGWNDVDVDTFFTDSDRTIEDPDGSGMRFIVPIGADAVLLVDGEGVTDPMLLRAFALEALT